VAVSVPAGQTPSPAHRAYGTTWPAHPVRDPSIAGQRWFDRHVLRTSPNGARASFATEVRSAPERTDLVWSNLRPRLDLIEFRVHATSTSALWIYGVGQPGRQIIGRVRGAKLLQTRSVAVALTATSVEMTARSAVWAVRRTCRSNQPLSGQLLGQRTGCEPRRSVRACAGLGRPDPARHPRRTQLSDDYE